METVLALQGLTSGESHEPSNTVRSSFSAACSN
jgi:hypothetical protein